jgi:hypothetical protein
MTKMANLPEILLEYTISGKQLISRNFASVRKNSSEISKMAIKDMLGLDVSGYYDGFFGWRGLDDVPDDIDGHLRNGARLLRRVDEANRNLRKFNDISLDSILRKQWSQTKADAMLSCLPLGFDSSLDAIDLSSVRKFQEVCKDNAKVLLYGIGGYCSSMMEEIDSLPIEVLGFADTNRHGETFHGKRVYPPSDIPKLDYDYIVITSPIYSDEIHDFLANVLSIGKERIVPFFSAREVEYHTIKRGISLK